MFLGGLVIGSLVGISLGVAMGRFRGFEAAVGMYIYAIYSTPLVALIPLISLWFGFGIEAQLIIISMFVMFPVTIAVYNGVRSVDPGLVEVAKSFRASERDMWKHVIIPSVVPYIVTGLSQGVAMGLVGMFISEIYTQLSGMGQLLAYTANAYKTADMLAVLLTVMIMGIFFRWVIETFRKRMAPWFNPDSKR
jgi:NitT/TauT family transport system permease protein